MNLPVKVIKDMNWPPNYIKVTYNDSDYELIADFFMTAFKDRCYKYIKEFIKGNGVF